MFLKSLRSSSWRERHSADTVLLDRALGKPVQAITGEVDGSVSLLHLVAVTATGERIIAKLETRRPGALLDGSANGSHDATVEVPASVGDLNVPSTE